MQISYVGQYTKNAGQTVGTPVPGTAVTSLSAAVRELAPGSIFEGNISYVKGSNVILSLENGQSIHARLDKNAFKLVQGQSMFFQVKSNEGGTVAIRPYMGGGTSNPTLMQALSAAGLPANERNLQMVNAMMKEQLPIHADALMEMHRAIVGNEGVSVDTLVQMQRLGLPISVQLAAQFENYQSDTHLLLHQMDEFMGQLSQLLEVQESDAAQVAELNTRLLGILTDGLEPEKDALEVLPQQADAAADGVVLESSLSTETEILQEFAAPQLGACLEPQEQESFSDLLRSIGELAENEQVFDADGDLRLELTARRLLSVIDDELQAQLANGTLETEDVKELVSYKGYQRLLHQVMEDQWLLKPEEVKEKDKVSHLYERLNRQMQDISKLLKATGNEQSALGRSVEQIRSNIDFMNQVNQIYNYVQIPLKMNGQNANGDLYVYTNKRRVREENGELSAFLHLDMEHLGSTDVSVKLKGKAVDTKFSFSDDASFTLVQQYLPLLEAKLSALGYHATITVSNEAEQMDFVEDFLKKDIPRGSSKGGVVHRYSFDVRA